MVNVKFETSKERTFESGVNIVFLASPGDTYTENMNYYDVYHISRIPTANVVSMMTEF